MIYCDEKGCSNPNHSMDNKKNYLLALVPLVPSLVALLRIERTESVRMIAQSLGIALVGFLLTNSLVPTVASYTHKAGLFGKDLGKKGTAAEEKEVPEALGLVSGTVFLLCTIFSQLVFAKNFEQLMVFNSALFSICFMVFLGFTDDTLELKWRYKLILPTVASLPLLVAYSGPTAVLVPPPFQALLMRGGHLTALGGMLDVFVTVDTQAHGSVVELGMLFLLYMGLLAVFCTNAINIYAGINGLECGQAYIVACSLLFFKLFELQGDAEMSEHQMFSLALVIPFLATSLALLRHNWYPASVFVGDTYCYFAGMTFAVIGIHGHFSKTLLLLFIPQIINFVYSLPQLLRLLPCPRHRLPRVDPAAGTLRYSAFPCGKHELRWLKISPDAEECPNFTLICAVLRLTGPLRERTLCVSLLALQVLTSCLAFFVRYYLLEHAIIVTRS